MPVNFTFSSGAGCPVCRFVSVRTCQPVGKLPPPATARSGSACATSSRPGAKSKKTAVAVIKLITIVGLSGFGSTL